MRPFIARSLFVMFAALAAAGPVAADSVINNTGILDPDQTITFSEFTFPRRTEITTQYQSLGVTFSPGMFYDAAPFFFPTESISNFRFNIDEPADVFYPISIQFTQVVEAAAFALQSVEGTARLTAKLGGVTVESFEAGSTFSVLPDVSQASNFYGFEGIAFDEIVVEVNLDGVAKGLQIDNLQYRVVPEPSSVALLGAGIVGLALAARRSRRSR